MNLTTKTTINPNKLFGSSDQNGIYINDNFVKDNLLLDIDENTPFKFFLVDNNRDSTRNKTNQTVLTTSIRDYQIGFSQGYIFDEIFRSVGVKTQGNLFEDAKFYNTLVCDPTDLTTLNELTDNKTYQYGFFKEDGQPRPFRTIPVFSSGTKSTILFDSGESVDEWNGTEITLQGGCTNLNVYYSLPPQNVTTTPDVYYDVYKNGTIISGKQDVLMTLEDGKFVLEEDLGALNQGDVIRFEFAADNVGGGGMQVGYGSIMNFKFTQYTAKVSSTNLIPNIDQADFVKDVLTQFGAVTQYDAKTRTLTCNKLDLIEDRKIYSPDWSDKIDLSKTPNINLTKLVEKYGKRSFFKYSEYDESDLANRTFFKNSNYRLGTGALIISNDFLTDDQDVYESPYAPTVMLETFPYNDPNNEGYQTGNLFIPFVPTYTLTGENNGVKEYDNNDLNPRKFIYIDTFTY